MISFKYYSLNFKGEVVWITSL